MDGENGEDKDNGPMCAKDQKQAKADKHKVDKMKREVDSKHLMMHS